MVNCLISRTCSKCAKEREENNQYEILLSTYNSTSVNLLISKDGEISDYSIINEETAEVFVNDYFKGQQLEEKNGISDRKKLMISTLMPLHVCNSFAASLLGSFGVTMVQASPELGRQEMEKLCAKSPLPVEIYLFGRPVLLGTRAFLPVEGKMEDSKGEVFLVEKEKNLTLILPEKTMEIELCKGASGAFYDCRNIRGGEKGTAHFNFDVTLA